MNLSIYMKKLICLNSKINLSTVVFEWMGEF